MHKVRRQIYLTLTVRSRTPGNAELFFFFGELIHPKTDSVECSRSRLSKLDGV